MEQDLNRREINTSFSENSKQLGCINRGLNYPTSEDIYEINEFLKKFNPNLPPTGETDFEPIFKKVISLDKSIKWITHRTEFMGYMRHKRKRVLCSIYGPEDIELYLTSGHRGLDYKIYAGPEVSDLYRKLSSI